MNKTLKRILRFVLFAGLALLGVFVGLYAVIAIRYTPGYAYREFFMDIGSPYDYRILPQRQLSASSDPFIFAEDSSKEALVQEIFQRNPLIKNLDGFQSDKLIYERYFMGYQRNSIVTSFSVAKSFDSALVGIAIQEGLIKSVNDPITDYIPELSARDTRFNDIQIRHLLMMASGLRYDSGRFISFGDDNLTSGFDNLRHLALTETEITEKPGTAFLYNNYNPLLLGLILERVTGMPVTMYLQQKIWTPLEMEFDGSWNLDAEENGFEKMETGINARAIDFAKLGRLYLHQGNWNGDQIIPSDWVEDSTADNGIIKDAPIYYGYMWWGETCNSESKDFLATGDYGQFIYVSPAKNLIIVRNGENYGVESSGEEWVVWADAFCQFAKSLP
jgi:CubicO group peptidase (beta-lactamase class C family)